MESRLFVAFKRLSKMPFPPFGSRRKPGGCPQSAICLPLPAHSLPLTVGEHAAELAWGLTSSRLIRDSQIKGVGPNKTGCRTFQIVKKNYSICLLAFQYQVFDQSLSADQCHSDIVDVGSGRTGKDQSAGL